MRWSPSYRSISGPLTQLLAVLSLFYLFRGHNAPGGGFVGGLILCAALILRAFSHGPEAARALIGLDPRTLVGIGLVVAAFAATLGLVVKGTLLAPLSLGHVPALGAVGTVLLFDVGVYIVVAGTSLTLLLASIEEAP